jgi:hypothetical protein
MAGVLFMICIPREEYELCILNRPSESNDNQAAGDHANEVRVSFDHRPSTSNESDETYLTKVKTIIVVSKSNDC